MGCPGASMLTARVGTVRVSQNRAVCQASRSLCQRPSRLPRQPLPGPPVRRLCRVNAVQSDGEAKPLAVKAQKDVDPSPFFEPFVRSFLLGLGAGCVLEIAHVAHQFFGMVGEVGFSGVGEMLPKFGADFGPLFAADHVAAVGFWALFYIIEAAAVMSVLNRHRDDTEAATRALGSLVTLPKKMLPMKLQIFKQILLRAPGARQALPAASAFADTGAVMAPPRFTKPQGTSSVVTLPRPLTPKPALEEPPKQAPKAFVAEPKLEVERPGAAAERMQRGLKPGEMDADVARFLKRQGELQSRRQYLKNFWYAAAISDNVKEKPVGVEILGEKVVLFRGKDGQVVCISDVCPHRGAPLHMGWVAEYEGHDCVVCPYHGWAFDAEGRLRDVPAAEKKDDWPQKPVLPAYDVVEKGGFVWLYYGPKQMPASVRPPIPFVPELEDPTWRPVYGEIEFECGHWSVFENAIDMAHIHYLHNDTFGNQDQPEIRDMKVHEDAYSVTANFRLHNKPVRGWEWSKVSEVHVTAKAMLPSTSVIAFTLGNGLSFTTFVNTVPISADRSINRFALIRNLQTGVPPLDRVFNMAAWDRFARQAMLRILGEDKAMVEQLRPDLLVREVNVKADRPQTAFRKLRQQWIDLGYGALPEETETRFRPDLRPDF